MAFVVKDRVKVTTTTTGTSDFTLGSASLGFQNFSVIGDGNVTYYAATDAITGDWEVGIGTYTTSGPTLTRTTVLESSAGGSKVSFSAGSKDVFVTYPAERAVYLDTAGAYPVQNTFNALTASSIALTTGTITTAPTSNTDIVNKQYADAIASGIHFHEAVELATTAALPANTYNNGTSGVGATLTANANGALSVDSTLTVVANRVLVKNEVTQANNGVYTVTQVGSAGTPYILTRATDFDTAGSGVDQIDEGDFFLVTGGVANINTAWVQQTAPPITVGTTAIVFQQFAAPITYTAGTGLNESPAFTFNITAVGTAGTYGSASNVPVFVTNAQGQVTSVTNTGIAIASGAVSGLAASATTDTTNAANITSGTLPSGRISGSYTGLTGTGALAAGSLATGFTAVSAPLGGTGQTSYAVGDLIYADTTTSLAKLADVAVGNALISGGVGSAPSYGKIGLATHVSGTLPVANGGTGVTSSTGTGSVVLSDSPTLVTPALGTPSSATLTNATGLPIATGVSGLGTGVATFLATPSSANLASAVTDETGSGSLVFATSPTLVTPALGTPASGVVTNLTGTASININGTVGATTASTGAFTSLAYSTTLTGGTGIVNLGSGQFYKDASGNVGIGTTGPTSKLHVSGGRTDLVAASEIYALGVRYGVGTGIYYIGASNSATPDLVFSQVGGSERMRLTNAGDLGIGTTAPSAKLHVVGSGLLTSTSAETKFTINNTGTGGVEYWIGSTNNSSGAVGGGRLAFYDQTSNAIRMAIDSSGNVGIGTASPTALLQLSSTGNPGLVFDGTNQGTNLKRIRLVTQITAAGDFAIQSMNDAGSVKSTNLYIDSSGNFSFNSGYGSAAVAYGCRAWVNFNGTGTVAINASGNVSSITDNGTGDYTVNFTTALPDINYALGGIATNGGAGMVVGLASSASTAAPTTKTTTAVRLSARTTTGTLQDVYDCNVILLR